MYDYSPSGRRRFTSPPGRDSTPWGLRGPNIAQRVGPSGAQHHHLFPLQQPESLRHTVTIHLDSYTSYLKLRWFPSRSMMQQVGLKELN